MAPLLYAYDSLHSCTAYSGICMGQIPVKSSYWSSEQGGLQKQFKKLGNIFQVLILDHFDREIYAIPWFILHFAKFTKARATCVHL